MTQAKFLKSGVAAALVMFAASSFAAPTTLDFTKLDTSNGAVASFPEDGFKLTNDCAGLRKNIGTWRNPIFVAKTDCLLSDASGRGNNKNTWAYTKYENSVTTLARLDGGAFNLDSIELDDHDQRNGWSDNTIDFTFKHAKGGDTKKTVTLNRTNGLQNVVFSESNLISASWTSSKWVEFDNIQTSAVPEPTSLALLPLALGGAFFASRRRKAAAK